MVGSILDANLPGSYGIDEEIEERAQSSEEFDQLNELNALQVQASQMTARKDTSGKNTMIYVRKIKD